MLFPDEVLIEIRRHLTAPAEKVLAIIFQQKFLNKTQIRRLTGLSEKVSNEAIARLEGACFISWGEDERSKVYYLTENGKKICRLIQEEEKQ